MDASYDIKLDITTMLEVLSQALERKDWESAEIIANSIRNKAQSEDLYLSDREKNLVACAIAFRDITLE